MLRLIVADVDICRISKALGKYRLKSSVTQSQVLIDNYEVPEEVVYIIFENATILGAQNYQEDDSDAKEFVETESEKEDEPITIPIAEESKTDNLSKVEVQEEAKEESEAEMPTKESEEAFVYSENVSIKSEEQKLPKLENVYRGEVYKYITIAGNDREGKVKECVIIIQNDNENSQSEETIAVYCISDYKVQRNQMNFSFALTEKTMKDYNEETLGLYADSGLYVSHVMGVSRRKLGKYLGTMNDNFMNALQPKIDFCLGLKRTRDINYVQLKILSTINMEELFKISESKVSDEEKTQQFLELFGFDMSNNGMEYIKEAILIARHIDDYRLEDLIQGISKKYNVEAGEVLRTIVVRIKEKFNFKKSAASSFIRLIEGLLKKG